MGWCNQINAQNTLDWDQFTMAMTQKSGSEQTCIALLSPFNVIQRQVDPFTSFIQISMDSCTYTLDMIYEYIATSFTHSMTIDN